MLVWSTLDHTGFFFFLKLKITLLVYVQHEQFQTGPTASTLLDLQTWMKHFIYSHLEHFYFSLFQVLGNSLDKLSREQG